MKMNKLYSLLCTGVLSCAVCTSVFAKDTVTVSGSTTVLPVMQKITEQLMSKDPSLTIELSGGGSGNGIKALNDGLTQIAMSSRKISEKEIQAAQSKNVSPYPTTVAIDMIVPIVHPNNSASDLSLENLRKIFKGEIKNWKEVGGADAPIVPVSRDSSSGTFETWSELVMHKQRITPRALLQSSNGTVVQTVAKHPNAIGYISFGYVVPTVKALQVNGIKASKETALNGTWPLSRALYLYTNGAPANAVKKVTDYSLSDEGRELIQKIGFLPLQKP